MTADPRAVEIIADALKDHALLRFKGLRYGCEGCDWSRPWDDDEALEDYEAHLGRVAVAVLVAAGWSLLPPGGQTRDLMRDMELVAAQLDRTARGRSILRDLTSTHVADAYHDAAMRVREALATHRPPSDTPEVDRG